MRQTWVLYACMILKTVWQSYDPTTHFETTVQDVLSMYTRITGKVSLFPHLFTWRVRIWNCLAFKSHCVCLGPFETIFLFTRIQHFNLSACSFLVCRFAGRRSGVTCMDFVLECRTWTWVWIWVLQVLRMSNDGCYILNCFFFPADCESFVIPWSSSFNYLFCARQFTFYMSIQWPKRLTFLYLSGYFCGIIICDTFEAMVTAIWHHHMDAKVVCIVVWFPSFNVSLKLLYMQCTWGWNLIVLRGQCLPWWN